MEVRVSGLSSGWPKRADAREEPLVPSLGAVRLAPLQMRRMAQGGPIGLTVGSGWRIERAIGSGGSATVFRASKADGRAAAIKLMHHQLAGAWTKRFEREAKLLQSLSHPAIPQLYEFGRLRGVPFLVLELLTGRALDGVSAEARSKESVAQILAHADQALQALAVVHARGIVHRDLKPSNLFLTDEGVLKVLDFGAAIDVDTSSISADSLTSGLLGTPAYMPPEQARGRWDMVDRRSDIWSLGAVLFTLLSGEHVHRAQTPNEQLSLAMMRSARSLSAVAPELDGALVRVIARALSYEREERFQSAEDFRQALLGSTDEARLVASDCLELTAREKTATAVSERQSSRKPPGTEKRRWHNAVWVGGACFGFSALALAFVPAEPVARSPRSKGTAEIEPQFSSAVVSNVSLTTTAPSSAMSSDALPAASATVVRDAARGRADAKRTETHAPIATARIAPREPALRASVPKPEPSAVPAPAALDIRLRTVDDEQKAIESRAASKAAPPTASPLDIRK